MLEITLVYVLLSTPLPANIRQVDEFPTLEKCAQQLVVEAKRNPGVPYTCQPFVKPMRRAPIV